MRNSGEQTDMVKLPGQMKALKRLYFYVLLVEYDVLFFGVINLQLERC